MEATHAAAALEPSLTIPIVDGALVRILEHLVRLGDFLEALFGVLGPVVLVRMILHRHPAIRFLDVVVTRVASDAERRIKIGHGCRDTAIRECRSAAVTCDSPARSPC